VDGFMRPASDVIIYANGNDVIVHANSKRKEAIVEIYDIACSTNTKAFQGLALSYVTMHFESLLAFFSNP
jgi:hypothetical protein